MSNLIDTRRLYVSHSDGDIVRAIDSTTWRTNLRFSQDFSISIRTSATTTYLPSITTGIPRAARLCQNRSLSLKGNSTVPFGSPCVRLSNSPSTKDFHELEQQSSRFHVKGHRRSLMVVEGIHENDFLGIYPFQRTSSVTPKHSEDMIDNLVSSILSASLITLVR